MGLVKQLDDQLGRLFAHLTARGLWSSTLVVFCSDHGDYLGDHWLGEKELFHDTVVAVPLIVVHPDSRAHRGVVEHRLVEAIDLLPTFVECVGGAAVSHHLEGRSLLPILMQPQAALPWREYAISEGDHAFRNFVRAGTGQPVQGCRMFMVRSRDWKYVRHEGLPAQLFNLREDPLELTDRGRDEGLGRVRAEHEAMLFEWLRNRKIHPTVSDLEMDATTTLEARSGTHIGVW
jgi:arylsulfatase A-like enzyme